MHALLSEVLKFHNSNDHEGGETGGGGGGGSAGASTNTGAEGRGQGRRGGEGGGGKRGRVQMFWGSQVSAISQCASMRSTSGGRSSWSRVSIRPRSDFFHLLKRLLGAGNGSVDVGADMRVVCFFLLDFFPFFSKRLLGAGNAGVDVGADMRLYIYMPLSTHTEIKHVARSNY
jgi:hypothetical protein